MPSIRHPISFSTTPPSYPLPPPALDEHGEQVRAWLAAPRSASSDPAAPPNPPPWAAAEDRTSP